MKTKNSFLLSLALLVAAAGAGGAVASDLPTAALGSSGEVVELIGGTYGELFPESGEVPPEGDKWEVPADHEVLALELSWPDQTTERRLLPDTEDAQAESLAALLYDRSTDALVAIWQSEEPSEGALLKLVPVVDGAFSDVVTIEDPTLASIGPSKIVLTRDRYSIRLGEDQRETVNRTILHVTWMAFDGSEIDVRYTPLVFIDGLYCGWNEVFSLRDLLVGEGVDPNRELSDQLLSTLELEVTRGGQRILATFVSPRSGELAVVDIGVLPLELAYLGDEVRDLLLSMADEFVGNDLQSFAGGARLEIIGVGRRHSLNPALVDYVAGEVSDEILAVGAEYSIAEFGDLVSYLRDFTIDVTSPLITSTLNHTRATDNSQVIEIDIGNLLHGPTQILDLKIRSSRPAPATGEGPTTVYTSEDGEDTLIAWEDPEDGRLYYVESLEEGWSEPRSLLIDEKLTPERAHELLKLRVR
ncbi:MAG: hypothetical protein GY856_00170 [bacterium]|nr:hypothetical protein [bacterium]